MQKVHILQNLILNIWIEMQERYSYLNVPSLFINKTSKIYKIFQQLLSYTLPCNASLKFGMRKNEKRENTFTT